MIPRPKYPKGKGIPPQSNRYCLACEKVTIWTYNRGVCHSRCSKCGGMLSKKP